MNFSHLTFGQLFRLQHQKNLMRVTAAYHGMLERYFLASPMALSKSFTVLAGKQCAPWRIVQAWENVLGMLTSQGLQRLLRVAAEGTTPRWLPGHVTDLSFCYARENNRYAAAARAVAIRQFSERCGIPAWVRRAGSGDSEVLTVKVATDELGAAVIRYKLGPTWEELSRGLMGAANPHQVFWWVPAGFQGRVNPCLKPIQTPDYAQQVQNILTPA